MKTVKMIVVSILMTALGLAVPFHGLADEDKGEKARSEKTDAPKGKPATAPTSSTKEAVPEMRRDMPVYKPPMRGTPGSRVAAGTRGEGDGSLVLSALVPDHVGLTIQEQPSLYWFLSESTEYPVELTVIEAHAEKPLVEKRISGVIQPGVQCVRLADYGVRLKQGSVYQWFVAIVTNPDQRSKDIITGGEIQRIDPPEELRSELARSGKPDASRVYAGAGLWYDAVSAVSELIDAAPDKTAFVKQRAFLLQQVGLPEIAEYEMKR